jgi:hypothetical protein
MRNCATDAESPFAIFDLGLNWPLSGHSRQCAIIAHSTHPNAEMGLRGPLPGLLQVAGAWLLVVGPRK